MTLRPIKGAIERAASVWGYRVARALQAARPPGERQPILTDEGHVVAMSIIAFEAGARWGRENPGDPNE